MVLESMVKQAQVEGCNVERFMTAAQTLEFYKGDQDILHVRACVPMCELGGLPGKGPRARLRHAAQG